jgi:hypothetical protein
MRWIAMAVVGGLLASAAAEAQVYRWVDKDGKVHYSDKAPRDGTQAKDMNIQSNPTDPEAVEAEQQALRDQAAAGQPDEAARKAAADKKVADAAQRERACANAKADLNVLERSNRLVTVDADNKERIATSAELVARRDLARQRVAQLCD